MKTVVFSFILFLLAGVAAIYFILLRPEEIKARETLDNMDLIKVGMNVENIKHILGKPDTTYYYDNNDSIVVYHYGLGFLAPDDLRILVNDKDAVIDIISHN